MTKLKPEVWAPHQEYLDNIKRAWKKLVFLQTAYMCLKSGDILALISGVNNSGKSSTGVMQVRYAVWLLRNYWLTAPGVTEETRQELAKVKKFNMRDNVSYYPDTVAIRERIATQGSFICLAITEGMRAAINLKSYDIDVIDLIVELFTERQSHNFISWEYQLTKRSPKLLTARYNVWYHKPAQEYMIVSMPSSVYRTDDPMYTHEIEKIKGDKNIGKWFTHKSGNSNYICTLKSPRMKPKMEAQFKAYRKEAKDLYERGKKIKKSTDIYWAKIEDYHNQIKSGSIIYFALPEILKTKHNFTDDEVRKFLKDYQRFQTTYKLSHPTNKSEEDEL